MEGGRDASHGKAIADGWNEEESARKRTREGLAKGARPRGGVQAGVLVGRTGHPRAKTGLGFLAGREAWRIPTAAILVVGSVGGENREAGREGLTTVGVWRESGQELSWFLPGLSP